jgi:uncharacterized protein (TIGR02453 family)
MKETKTFFSKKSFEFLGNLSKNNSKEWFDSHKSDYLKYIKEPSLEFASEILSACPKQKIPFMGEPKNCIFRQNRDIRFSHNKEPYKTNAGISFTKNGKKNSFGLGYVHLAPEGCFIAVGFYMPETFEILKIRDAIVQKQKEFEKILSLLEKNSWSWDFSMTLKKIPPNYKQFLDTKIEPFLKLKSFTVSKKLTQKEIVHLDFPTQCLQNFKEGLKLLEFGWQASEFKPEH